MLYCVKMSWEDGISACVSPPLFVVYRRRFYSVISQLHTADLAMKKTVKCDKTRCERATIKRRGDFKACRLFTHGESSSKPDVIRTLCFAQFNFSLQKRDDDTNEDISKLKTANIPFGGSLSTKILLCKSFVALCDSTSNSSLPSSLISTAPAMKLPFDL